MVAWHGGTDFVQWSVGHTAKTFFRREEKHGFHRWMANNNPVNREYPQMDGLFHGKPYEQMDDLGGKNPYFWTHPNGQSLNENGKTDYSTLPKGQSKISFSSA